jgi:hypothetical protein
MLPGATHRRLALVRSWSATWARISVMGTLDVASTATDAASTVSSVAWPISMPRMDDIPGTVCVAGLVQASVRTDGWLLICRVSRLGW